MSALDSRARNDQAGAHHTARGLGIALHLLVTLALTIGIWLAATATNPVLHTIGLTLMWAAVIAYAAAFGTSPGRTK